MNLKTLPLVLSVACSIFASSATAQITIEKSDYPIDNAEGYRRSYARIENPSSFVTPSGGANMLWNYRGTTGSFLADFNYYTSSDPFFNGSFHYEAGRVELSVFGVPTDFHHRFDANGYTEFAKEQHDSTMSLTDITGKAGDNIHFTADKQLYNGEVDRIQFPIAYQQNWSDQSIRTTPFELTIQDYGINQVSGYHKAISSLENEVIGYGKLLMSYKGANSDTMEVLLQKSVLIGIDSFFLGGAPAPESLLQALGLVQGSAVKIVTYSFYRKGWGDLLLEFRTDSETPGATPYGMNYSVYGIEYPLSVYNPKATNASIRMFPNPSAAGSSLHMEWNESIQEAASYTIIDLQGKVLATCMDQSTDANSAEIRLPSQMPKGIYFVQAKNASGAVLFQKKLVISE